MIFQVPELDLLTRMHCIDQLTTAWKDVFNPERLVRLV